MTTEQTGQVASWSDVKGKGGNSKDDYLKLVDGDNEVRVLGPPAQYVVHYYKQPGDNGKGDGPKVKCTMTAECPLCKDGNPRANRWYVPLIDRKTKMLKVLDCKWGIVGNIKKLNDGKWGNPVNYDMSIVVDRNGGATGYYTCQPSPDGKSPLSPDDIEKKKSLENNPDFLGKKCAPLTPAEVLKKMEWIRNPTKPGQPGQVQQGKPTQTAASTVVESSTGSDEFDFTPHEEEATS